MQINDKQPKPQVFSPQIIQNNNEQAINAQNRLKAKENIIDQLSFELREVIAQLKKVELERDQALSQYESNEQLWQKKLA